MIPGGVNSPGAGLPIGRRHAVLRGPGRGRPRLGRRGHAATSTSCSPTARSIAGHAHPRDRRGRAAGGRRRHVLRRADRGRGAAGRGDLRPGAVVRARCGWCRAAPRPRCRPSASPAALTGRDQVVKFAGNYHGHGDVAPRRGGGQRRIAADTPGGYRARPASPPRAVADTMVVPYNVVPELDDDTWPASSSSRSPPTWAWSPRPTASSKGLRDRVRPGRRAADLRRGHHRVPRSAAAAPRSRFGVTPRPHAASARSSAAASTSARSAGAADVMEHLAPARARVPGRHAVGEPARHRRRAGRAVAARRRAPTRTLDATGRPAGRAASRTAFADAGLDGARAAGRRRSSACYFGADAADRLRRARSAPTTARYAAFFHAMLDRGRRPGARRRTRSLFPGLAHDDRRSSTVDAAADAAQRWPRP